MDSKVLKYTELALFYGGVSLNIWILFHFTFLGLGDGPSHLYYSKVVQYLLSGNSFLSQYFVLNHLPVPNLTDHYLVALLDVFFPTAISEKILLLLFMAGFPLIFRFILKRYNPEGLAASSFIIPLTHCTMLYFGWYNFCLSFTFLFAAIYYFLKNFSDAGNLYSPLKYFLFFLLILLNYFTNGLSFLFLFFICELAELYWLFRQRKPKAINNRHIVKRFLLFSTLWIPGFIMLNIFNSQVTSLHHSTLLKIPISQLFQWVYDFKCLFVHDGTENFYTHILFFWLIITLSITVYFRLKNKTRLKFVLTDIFLLLFIITFIAYFITPQGAGVGMISDRLLYYFIIFLVVWIALQKNMGKISLLLSGVVMTIHIMFFFSVHYHLLSKLNKNAMDVQEASAYIEPNSVIFLVRYDQNPMELSIGNILGIDKPVVVLEKYEPDAGWFAVNRTMGEDPEWRVERNEKYNILGWYNTKNSVAKFISVINYMFIDGDYYGELREDKGDFKKIAPNYTKVFSSDDNKIHILRLNKKIDYGSARTGDK